MATDGLTGGVNPFGNRGPDLIETIRLEKIVGNPFLGTAGSEGISKPHASVHVEDIPGHPRMGRKTIVRRPRSGPSQGRGWAEPAWNRPNTAQSSLQVHNDELKGEVLTPADPLPKSPSYAGSTGQRTHSPLGSPGGALSPSPGGGGSPQGSVASRTPSNPSQGTLVRPQTAPLAGSKEHKRELFRLKGAERQEKILQRLQLSQKARRDQGERDFAQLWDSITKTEATLVADVTEFLDLKQADAKRKQAALHREWHEKVFDPIQVAGFADARPARAASICADADAQPHPARPPSAVPGRPRSIGRSRTASPRRRAASASDGSRPPTSTLPRAPSCWHERRAAGEGGLGGGGTRQRPRVGAPGGAPSAAAPGPRLLRIRPSLEAARARRASEGGRTPPPARAEVAEVEPPPPGWRAGISARRSSASSATSSSPMSTTRSSAARRTSSTRSSTSTAAKSACRSTTR